MPGAMSDAARPQDDTSEIGRLQELWENDRIELIATVLLAVAAILTAWSAFQSAKWSGMQSIHFSEAGAARTESTRFDTRAGQLVQIDVGLWTQWVSALSADLDSGAVVLDNASEYEPTPGTLSGFLFVRFRDEFKPAVAAWLATDPVDDPDAPPSPFAMEEYVVADAVTADELSVKAEASATEARASNQNSDNYVLTAVLFATVLFFAGISSKLAQRRNRVIAVGIGVILVVVAAGILIGLPKLI